MMNRLLICGIVLICACSMPVRGKAHYATYLNRFSSLLASGGQGVAVDGDCLVEENRGDTGCVRLDSMSVPSCDYSYMVRIANEHNTPGHTYKLPSGKRLKTTACGLAFNYASGKDYYVFSIASSTASLHDDIADERIAVVQVSHVIGDSIALLRDTVLHEADGIDAYSQLNALQVKVEGNAYSFLIGKKRLRLLWTLDLPVAGKNLRMGYYVGPGAKTRVERAVYSQQGTGKLVSDTGWSLERLKARFIATKDPLEGFWQYLDRDVDDKIMRLGGRYTIALVATEQGYDIIYVDGAKVGQGQWRCGMLKGQLKRTIFTGHYNGMWVDATFEPISEDVYCELTDGVILALKLPVYNSQVRFSKCLNAE